MVAEQHPNTFGRRPPPIDPLRIRDRPPAAGLFGAIALHGLAMLALIAAWPERSGAQGGIVSVTLVNGPPAEGARTVSSEAGLTPFAAMEQRLRTPERVERQEAPSTRQSTSLTEILGGESQQPSRTSGGDPTARSGGGLASAGDDPYARASASEPASIATTIVNSRLKECWSRSRSGRVPVRLSISLDGQGRLAAAPKVLRVGTRAPARDSQAAQDAISVALDCAPYPPTGADTATLLVDLP